MSSSRFVQWQLLLIVFCAIANGFTVPTLNQTKPSVSISNGFDYALVLDRLDSLEHRFTELFADLKTHHQRLEDELRTNMSLLTEQSRNILQEVDPMERYRFGEGWQVVMQRFDGSEDFHRNWADYRNGFGATDQEFWLGLEQLHQLTSSAPYEVLVNMKDFLGNHRYARYSKFSVGSEVESYPLKELGSYSGTAGDSLTFHKGSPFSATDRGPFRNCVDLLKGGWWYTGWKGGDDCYDSHLTGNWDKTNDWASIVWMTFGSPQNRALKFVRMSIRKLKD